MILKPTPVLKDVSIMWQNVLTSSQSQTFPLPRILTQIAKLPE